MALSASSSLATPARNTPTMDDYRNLRELLEQALKREAEALRKVKHLHDLLAERSASGGEESIRVIQTPDIWDQELSQLSQDSSPQSPTPALVVSGSPSIGNKHNKSMSQPSSPTQAGSNSVDLCSTELDMRSHESLHGDRLSYGLSNGDISQDDWRPLGDGETRLLLTSLPAGNSHLMPSPRKLKDVRREREKPPPTQGSPRCVTPEVPSTKTIKTAASIDGVQAPQSPVRMKGNQNTSHERKLVDSVKIEKIDKKVRRRSSLKDKDTGGHRTRSNTAIQFPSWLKRKKDHSRRAGLQASPASIADLFSRFSKLASANMLQEPLAKYIDHHWSEVCVDASCSPEDKQYREAVWDMFQSEAKYLIRSLQPLEQVYKGFLEELHFHDILKIADVDKIFANLSELCELSSSVANDLFRLFEGRSGKRVAPNNELILSFSMFGHKFNPVYQRFCVNFEKQRGFVRALQQLPEFQEYHLLCRCHEFVGKNDLTALLIAPMQHQCHYQLLLDKVLKYTKDPSEKSLLSSTIKAFVVSLKELEGHIDDHKRSAELLELQETLSWPSVLDLDMEDYKPESLCKLIASQQCSTVLASKDRQLVYKGTLKLLDCKARSYHELQVFLFTDLLLFTEQKTTNKKLQGVSQLTKYLVYGHPLFLSLVEVYDPPFSQAHKHIITLVENTVLEQRIRVYSLQTAGRDNKAKWLTQLLHTQDLLRQRNNNTLFESDI